MRSLADVGSFEARPAQASVSAPVAIAAIEEIVAVVATDGSSDIADRDKDLLERYRRERRRMVSGRARGERRCPSE